MENGGTRLHAQDHQSSPVSPKINGGDKGSSASKKPARSSLSKPKTQNSSTTTKVKNVEAEKVEDRPHCSPVEEATVKDSSLCNGRSEAVPADVSIEG